MARTSRKQAQVKAEQAARDMANALNIITKPIRTTRIQPIKTMYNLINDDNGDIIGTSREYNDDMAIMCALRVLAKLKKDGNAPRHASLIIGEGEMMGEVIQGFYRRD